MPQRILDDDRRRHATQPPPALRVGASGARLLLCDSSTMRHGIAVVAAHCIQTPDVPNAHRSRFPNSLLRRNQ